MAIEPLRENLKAKILELSNLYETYKKKYGKEGIGKLSEADIKKDFINPLFQALGWVITNSWEYDEETYVRGAGFVDISIWIDDPTTPDTRVPKIFVEAKKFGKIESVSERGKQTDLYGKRIVGDWTLEERQILNYCAQAKIRWAVLTNYEKFRVFNAFNGLTILDIDSPTQYMERLDDLLYLSKDSVISRRVEELETREERPDIDEGFLERMEYWRKILASNIYERNPSLTFEQIKEATQRILDRFVIVRSAEDRLILDSPDLMKDTYDYWSKHSGFGSLSDMFFGHNQIFHNFDRLYNSRIFERGHICESVKVDDKVLGTIIAGLYLVNFRKFSSDILGRTYESYLGGTFAIENGKLTVKTSMETRKSTGIYYTPRYIVDYIVSKVVRNSVEPIWKDTAELISKNDFRKAEEKFQELSDIKVLDPSMGSGTFLISAYYVFQEYYERYNDAISAARKEIIGKTNNGIEEYNHLPNLIENYAQKILKENIYGVDLDGQATEIGAVNLMLQALKRGEKLPLILEENIKTGNSLIPGKVDRALFAPYKEDIAKLIQIRKKLKDAINEETKQKLLDEESSLKTPIILEVNELLKIGDKLKNSKPFFMELEFPEVFFNENGTLKAKPGFSCIIGNPPYGADFTRDEKKLIETQFTCLGSGNSAEFFLEQSVNLVQEDGTVGMIVPKTVAFYNDWKDIRSLLVNENRLTNLMDVGIGFLDVNYEELILIFKRSKKEEGTIVTIDSAEPVKTYLPNKEIKHLGTIDRALMDEATTIIFRPVSDEEEALIKKLSSLSYKFEEIFGKVFRGLYIPDDEKKKLKGGKYLFINKVPDVDRYEIKKIMNIDIESNDNWVKEAKEIMVPRLFLKVMRGKRLVAYFDSDGSLLTTEKLVNVILKKDTKYKLPFLVALFNSPLLSFYIEKVVFSGTTETSRVLDRPYIKDLPIRKINFNTPEEEANSSLEGFKKAYIGLLDWRVSGSDVLVYTKRLLDKGQHDVVHDIISLLAEQMVILLNQRRVIYETFHSMVKKFRQDNDYKELKEYIDLKTVNKLKTVRHMEDFDPKEKQVDDYSVDLLGVEELIDYKRDGKVRGIKIIESGKALILSVFINAEEGYIDMLKIPIEDDIIRSFFLLAIKSYLERNSKKELWSKNKVFEVLETIKLPRSVPNIKSDVKNIKDLMKSFGQKIEGIIEKDFPNSILQTSSLNVIENAIEVTDHLIDSIIYQLYELTPREQEILKEFAR
jgi:hypothetical protein